MMESHNNQKKMAVINDLTGFGRCALTVVIPVISVMGLGCCPVPTSILSNHTAFPSCFIDDYTDKLEPYLAEWEKLGLKFDGIYTGFLGSLAQQSIVRRFLENFGSPETRIIIDPVMGDHGKTYRTYTAPMCEGMKALVGCGHLVTPNVTEACILTDTPYKSFWKPEELEALAYKLLCLGPQKAVITGIELPGKRIGNYCMEQGGHGILIDVELAGESRCGTGDLFASIIAADAVNGVPLERSVRKAAQFVSKTIKASDALEIPRTDGVCFEPYLWELGDSKKQCEALL